MRVLILALGSDGDIVPFLALAQRLLALGHAPMLATSDRYMARATALGIPVAKVGRPWDDRAAEEDMGKVLRERNLLQQLNLVARIMRELQVPVVPELLELARETDVVVYQPIMLAGAVVARKLGKPHVSVQLVPLLRGEHYSPIGVDLGRFCNRALWMLTAALLSRASDRELNHIVTAAGLAPWRSVLLDSARSSALELIAVSPELMTHDPAWGPNTRVTGYWSLAEAEFTPEPALERVARERPVVIGFGSMAGIDASKVTEQIVRAVRDLKRPVILQSGWAGLGASALPPNIHLVGNVPNAWLYERAACVVHHGGAGTIGAALRAGLPQGIVWHVAAGPIWDRKLTQLGVAPPPRSHHELTARWLRSTIDRMLTDTRMQEQARAVGQRVAREDGATTAVRAIENLVIRGSAAKSSASAPLQPSAPEAP